MQEHKSHHARPFLVALHAIWFAVVALLCIAFLVYLGICVASHCQLPTAKNGRTPLDLFRIHRLAILLEVVWLPIASWGLWCGLSWVRHLLLMSWLAVLAAALIPRLPGMPATYLVWNIFFAVATSALLWWYLFRKDAVVAFFSQRAAL